MTYEITNAEKIDKEKLHKDFGKRVHNLRLANYMTSRELAEYLGISESHLVKIQAGKRMPSINVLLKMCSIFGHTTDYMMSRKDYEGDDKYILYYQEQQFKFLISCLTHEQYKPVEGRLQEIAHCENGTFDDAIDYLRGFLKIASK